MNKTIDPHILEWLLQGDVSLQYQVYRDLLGIDKKELQNRIGTEGWGAHYISKQRPDGHWGLKFYQPKWTSSHYTLLDLRNLCISPENQAIRSSIDMIATYEKGIDKGVNPSGTVNKSDVCINGMFLNYACYFKIDEEKLKTVVDFILSQKMQDGGFNCMLNRSGAVHSSLHTTINTLEGITEYQKNGYTYRLDELLEARKSSKEFILIHKLYRSDKTGEIIKKDFLRIPYPDRWRYNILRALDYFRYAEDKFDERMIPALNLIQNKQNKDGTWPVNAKYPGQEHFSMEKAGKRSRWNTLRALRVLEWSKKYS